MNVQENFITTAINLKTMRQEVVRMIYRLELLKENGQNIDKINEMMGRVRKLVAALQDSKTSRLHINELEVLMMNIEVDLADLERYSTLRSVDRKSRLFNRIRKSIALNLSGLVSERYLNPLA